MPTQEQINAANTELQIANDNYAALSDRYNRYQQALQAYANASPEAQARARGAMQNLLDNYNQLRLDMYAAEDRVIQAQSAVNNLNTYVAPVGQVRRRQVRVEPQQYMTPVTDMVGGMSTVNGPRMGYITSNTRPQQYMTPVTDMVGGMSTVNGPRMGYVTSNTRPQQYMTPVTDMVGGMSTVNGPRMGYVTSNTRPQQYMTPVTDMVGGMSTVNGPRMGRL